MYICTQGLLLCVCLYCEVAGGTHHDMGGERWCTTKEVIFPDLKAGHVDLLVSYTKGLFHWTILLGYFTTVYNYS